jgi:hypothetical protein
MLPRAALCPCMRQRVIAWSARETCAAYLRRGSTGVRLAGGILAIGGGASTALVARSAGSSAARSAGRGVTLLAQPMSPRLRAVGGGVKSRPTAAVPRPWRRQLAEAQLRPRVPVGERVGCTVKCVPARENCRGAHCLSTPAGASASPVPIRPGCPAGGLRIGSD